MNIGAKVEKVIMKSDTNDYGKALGLHEGCVCIICSPLPFINMQGLGRSQEHSHTPTAG